MHSNVKLKKYKVLVVFLFFVSLFVQGALSKEQYYLVIIVYRYFSTSEWGFFLQSHKVSCDLLYTLVDINRNSSIIYNHKYRINV